MPKITIKEIDNTASVTESYANFSVVVPGFVGTQLDETGFDENGICEVSTKADFLKYIGKVKSVARDAKAPTLVSFNETLEKTLSHTEFLQYSDCIYSRVANEGTSDGYLSCSSDSETCLKGKYTKVNPEDFDDSTDYCVILKGNEGNDKESYSSFGNQIAYELVCLGYTVLFKKVGTVTDINDYDSFWACLEDKANYDFRYVCTGLLDENKSANEAITKLANTREDCIALLDVSKNVYSTAKTQSANISAIVSDVNKNFKSASKYVAIFAPTVTYDRVADSVYENNTLPGSFHYLVCATEAFATYPEWFAVAGYTRGISSDYKVLTTGVKFGEAAINALEPRNKSQDGIEKAINLIVKIKNSYYLWGNRTAFDLEEVDAAAETGDLKASHFLNIRQLCCTLKKQLYINCRKFTFEPNSDVLWINFVNAIEPLLEKMKANQGIEDYQIIKVKSTQKAKFSAIIRIVPIEAVEDFDLTITLEDSITGATVSVEE